MFLQLQANIYYNKRIQRNACALALKKVQTVKMIILQRMKLMALLGGKVKEFKRKGNRRVVVGCFRGVLEYCMHKRGGRC